MKKKLSISALVVVSIKRLSYPKPTVIY